MKTVYAFNPTTHVYQGEVQLGVDDISPLEPEVFLIPAGCVEVVPPSHDQSEFLEWGDGAWVVKKIPEPIQEPAEAPLTQEQLLARFTAAIQSRLDGFARSRHYDNILSACTYATSAVAKFKAEGQACVNLRDSTWAAAYAILEQVNSGQRPLPDDLADIEADLPALEWPQ
jgi:hypothetical protein